MMNGIGLLKQARTRYANTKEHERLKRAQDYSERNTKRSATLKHGV
jgi:hypothetical protein